LDQKINQNYNYIQFMKKDIDEELKNQHNFEDGDSFRK
jgi:hypothetical protein